MNIKKVDDKTLEYINYLYESIIDSDNRYVSVLSDAVLDYFKNVSYIENKFVIKKSKLYNHDNKLLFKLFLYMNDYEDLLSRKDVEYDSYGSVVCRYDAIFVFTITDDFNDCLNGTVLYKICFDKNVEEWDKFKDYIISGALKKIYNLYKKDFEIYILPNIENK